MTPPSDKNEERPMSFYDVKDVAEKVLQPLANHFVLLVRELDEKIDTHRTEFNSQLEKREDVEQAHHDKVMEQISFIRTDVALIKSDRMKTRRLIASTAGFTGILFGFLQWLWGAMGLNPK